MLTEPVAKHASTPALHREERISLIDTQPRTAGSLLNQREGIPDGLVALLATDVVGFTGMMQTLGDREAQQIIHAHNRLLRACLARKNGVEVFHSGDGILGAFRSVSSALGCAVEMQRDLEQYGRTTASQPLRVRMGLHAGEPLLEEQRLFGICVNTAVRVCSAASGARILVSDLVVQLALGGSFRFSAVGSAALKGLTPMLLHELHWRE